MRLYSTPQSAEALEVSVLAVLETLVAVGVSLWLVVLLDSWTHVAIGAALAPLVLLRTPESTELGLRWGDRMLGTKLPDWMESASDTARGASRVLVKCLLLVGMMFAVVAIVVWSALQLFGVRIAATAMGAFQHPLHTLASIPYNWTRICFCTDIAHPPEAIAGAEIFSFSVRPGSVSRGNMILVPIFGFHYLYHLSIKTTALVLAPLLWINSRATTKRALKTRLDYLHQSSMSRLVVMLSVGTIAFFVLKLFLYAGVNELATWWNSLSFSAARDDLVAPGLIPWWQVASTVNSGIALVLFFYADWTLTRIRNEDLDDGARKLADGITRTGAVVRAMLSLYTIACVLYIVSRLAWNMDWPPLGGRLFPWG